MWEVEVAAVGSSQQKKLLAEGWEPFACFAMQAVQKGTEILTGQPGMKVNYQPVLIYRRQRPVEVEDE